MYSAIIQLMCTSPLLLTLLPFRVPYIISWPNYATQSPLGDHDVVGGDTVASSWALLGALDDTHREKEYM